LLFTGVMPINANATNTIALWPGTVASTGAYRRELQDRKQWRQMVPLFVVSMLGSLAGARLLLRTPQSTFMRQVPWLLLCATLLFCFGGAITKWIRARAAQHKHVSRLTSAAVTLLQLIVAVYIGYFGAGAGMLMLALFALMGMENIHNMNAYKTLLTGSANGVALITFIVAGLIVWPQALLMIVGATIGGYGGAWYAQKLDPGLVRVLVIIIGAAMSAYFFWRR